MTPRIGKPGSLRATSALALLIIFFVMASSAGCLNSIRKISEGTASPEPTLSAPGDTPVPSSPPAPRQTQPPVVQITPMKSDVVTEVDPYITPDPYPPPHGININSTPRYYFLYRQPEYSRTYTLNGNAVGLLINVVQGPLYIRYTINPKHDCIKSPNSCRGTSKVPVNPPYMTITVRENRTQDIVAEDGYGRIYSSDTGKSKFTFSSSSGDSGYSGDSTDASSDSSGSGNDNTVIMEPGPRYIAIYKEGLFHVTLQGNYLDVTLNVITGASPDPLTAQEKSDGTAPVTPTPGDWG